jgi:transposase
VDAHGMPVRLFITAGTVADCTYGEALIANISAESLLADKGYDTDAIIQAALETGMSVVIPPKSNRKVQREYDEHLYKLRHLVENAFLKLKHWRGIATRYAKQTSSFLSTVVIKCIFIWLAILT